MQEIVGHRLPVDAGVTPPMPGSGLFAIDKIGMELGQLLPHGASLCDWHVVVLVAVEHVDAVLRVVRREQQRVADGRGARNDVPGLLRLLVADYQETRNMENVLRILPNTRVVRTSFTVR